MRWPSRQVGPPWWGLALLAFPGFVYTLGFDLAELVEAAAVLGAIVAIRRGSGRYRRRRALVLAVLTRETAMALPLAIVAVGCARHRAVAVEAAPLVALTHGRRRPASPRSVVAGLWQLLGWLRWDEVPMLGSADKNIRVPFAGLLAERDAFTPTSVRWAVSHRLARPGGARGAGRRHHRALAHRRGLRAGGRPRHEVVAFLVGVAVSTLLSEFVWAGATSFMRGLTEAWLLVARAPPQRHQRALRQLAPVVVLAARRGHAGHDDAPRSASAGSEPFSLGVARGAAGTIEPWPTPLLVPSATTPAPPA